MTRGKQWKSDSLVLGHIVARDDFQFRKRGLSLPNLNRIVATLEAGGEAKDPVRVARVGDILYLVDGFHRLEAYKRTGKRTIPALVAKMSLGEARDEAMRLNAQNGIPYSQADKQAIWQTFVASGRHLEPGGKARSCREISTELGGIYSRETVRKRIKAMGLEFDEETEFGGSYKPRGGDLEEAELLEAMAEEAEDDLRRFGERIAKLERRERERLLQVARGIVSAAEQALEPDLHRLFHDALPF